MDPFLERTVQPMLVGASSPPFDGEDFLFELKLDGERCIAYLDPDGGTELRNKRQMRLIPRFPELSNLHLQVREPCILDGELVILRDKKPNFYELQRRSMMTNRFRVELAAKKLPASFTAFDILYCRKGAVTSLPLTQRKALLEEVVREGPRFAVSRVVEGRGVEFYRLAAGLGLEGIVAKRKDSRYLPGTRTKEWVKIKNLLDDDFVVCGYLLKDQGMASLVLGQYRQNALCYKGHVTLGVSGGDFQRILRRPRMDAPPLEGVPPGHGNEDAVWITPELVCTVKFMDRTESGSLRQPVFKGLREDKTPKECVEPPKNPPENG